MASRGAFTCIHIITIYTVHINYTLARVTPVMSNAVQQQAPATHSSVALVSRRRRQHTHTHKYVVNRQSFHRMFTRHFGCDMRASCMRHAGQACTQVIGVRFVVTGDGDGVAVYVHVVAVTFTQHFIERCALLTLRVHVCIYGAITRSELGKGVRLCMCALLTQVMAQTTATTTATNASAFVSCVAVVQTEFVARMHRTNDLQPRCRDMYCKIVQHMIWGNSARA